MENIKFWRKISKKIWDARKHPKINSENFQKNLSSQKTQLSYHLGLFPSLTPSGVQTRMYRRGQSIDQLNTHGIIYRAHKNSHPQRTYKALGFHTRHLLCLYALYLLLLLLLPLYLLCTKRPSHKISLLSRL